MNKYISQLDLPTAGNLTLVKKVAYLTIDDGPSKDFKEKVDFLLSKNIPAIFFCRGDFLEQRADAVIYAIKKGFIIGNHSYSHTSFSEVTLEQCLEEIQKTDKIIDNLYKKAGVKRPAKFFRFPHGDKGAINRSEAFGSIQNFLRKLGYGQPNFKKITYKYYGKGGWSEDADWYWTYDALEWAVPKKEYHQLYEIDSLEKVFERMDEDVPEGSRGLNYPKSEEIILVHDHPETTHMFKPIIEHLLAKGMIFKPPPLK